ncbi:MAG TPA: hypothetical protein VHZ56_05010, partial [Devosia sp.]|nr:hypothetical protein [Devosia sp.]
MHDQAAGQRQARDLSYVIGRGALVRRNRIFRLLLSVATPIVVGALLNIVIYVSLLSRGPRLEAADLRLILPALAAIP